MCRQSLRASSDQEAFEPSTAKPADPSNRAASDGARGNAATETRSLLAAGHSPAKLQSSADKRLENQQLQLSPKKAATRSPELHQDGGRGANRERSRQAAAVLNLEAPSEDSDGGEAPAAAPPRAAGNKRS